MKKFPCFNGTQTVFIQYAAVDDIERELLSDLFQGNEIKGKLFIYQFLLESYLRAGKRLKYNRFCLPYLYYFELIDFSMITYIFTC